MRALEYVSLVSELNYMTQIVIMLYEDPTKETTSDQRFHVELHFSPGVNCCVQKDLPPGPGFRPHSRNNEQVNTGNTLQLAGDLIISLQNGGQQHNLFAGHNNTADNAELDSRRSHSPQAPILSFKCSEKQVWSCITCHPVHDYH